MNVDNNNIDSTMNVVNSVIWSDWAIDSMSVSEYIQEQIRLSSEEQ
jgi:hypothetical protein